MSCRCFRSNWSISFELSILCVFRYSQHFLMIFLMSTRFKIKSSFISAIGKLYIPFLTLFQSCQFHWLPACQFHWSFQAADFSLHWSCFQLISAFLFIIFFFLLALGAYCPFSRFSRFWGKSLAYYFETSFLIHAKNFPCKTALTGYHKFSYFVFSFLFIAKYFLFHLRFFLDPWII